MKFFIYITICLSTLGYSLAQEDTLLLSLTQKADSSYKFMKWETDYDEKDLSKFKIAKIEYYKILSLYPNNTYALDRVEEIDRVIDHINNKASYKNILLKAEYFFEAGHYSKSFNCFNKADSLSRNIINKEPKERLNFKKILLTEANELLSKTDQKEFINNILSCLDLRNKFRENLYEGEYNDSLLKVSLNKIQKAYKLHPSSSLSNKELLNSESIIKRYSNERLSHLINLAIKNYNAEKYENAHRNCSEISRIRPKNQFAKDLKQLIQEKIPNYQENIGYWLSK